MAAVISACTCGVEGTSILICGRLVTELPRADRAGPTGLGKIESALPPVPSVSVGVSWSALESREEPPTTLSTRPTTGRL